MFTSSYLSQIAGETSQVPVKDPRASSQGKIRAMAVANDYCWEWIKVRLNLCSQSWIVHSCISRHSANNSQSHDPFYVLDSNVAGRELQEPCLSVKLVHLLLVKPNMSFGPNIEGEIIGLVQQSAQS